jgi:biotin-(acetyl-CoA carboxylase) ligase
VGVNVGQREFPPELRNKATSIAMETKTQLVPGTLLELILARLYAELRTGEGSPPAWRERLDARLYLKGQRVRFIPGAAPGASSGGPPPNAVEGILTGIGSGGELLLRGEGGIRSYITGELDVYGGLAAGNVGA